VVRQSEHVAARVRIERAGRDRRAEGDESPRSVADRVAHHLRQFAGERALTPLHLLRRQDEVFQHQIVGDGAWHEHEI
jgi:hypothetical protein